MNCTIGIDARHFAAAIHCAAKKDVRYYLNGLFVEATETQTRVTATDGFVCAAFRATPNGLGNGMGGQERIELIVPRATVEQVNKAAKGKGFIELQCTDDNWQAVTDTARFSFAPIDGRFPDYRRIFPHAPSGELAQFNPELLAVFSKVGAALKTKAYPELVHNGTAGGLVVLNGCDDFAGVVMPFRVKPDRAPIDASWVSR